MEHLKYLGVIVVFFSLFLPKTTLAQKNYELRPLFELDQLSTGEAYAWISDNGLRIYYTAFDDINGVYAIWTSKRPSLDESFGVHRKLEINSSQNDNISSWLNKTETIIAFCKRTGEGDTETEIHLAKRKSVGDKFSETKKLELIGGVKGTIISPSFTQDLEQLIFFNEYKGHSYILVFKREDDYRYAFDYQLSFPKRYRVKTGKLSTDGLEYYVSVQDRRKNPSLYTFKRNHADEAFSEMIEMSDTLINDPTCRNHQHYFSSNKNFIVFTRSLENRWHSNSIYIAHDIDYNTFVPEQEAKVLSDEYLDAIVIYPNPSIDRVYFKHIENRPVTILLYDGQGKLVKEFNEISDDTETGISDLLPGSYYFKCIDNETGHYRVIKHIKLD